MADAMIASWQGAADMQAFDERKSYVDQRVTAKMCPMQQNKCEAKLYLFQDNTKLEHLR